MDQDQLRLILPEDVSPGALYDLLVAAVAPRPIGLISSQSRDGRRNLAPYSFFTVGGIQPPSLLYCPSNKKLGVAKDSLANVEATGEFVVNIVTREIAESMNATAADVAPDVDEWQLSGLTPGASTRVRPPYAMECPVSFECRLFQVIRHGEGEHGSNYVIGEVVAAHVNAAIWNEGVVQRSTIRPLGRMGGAEYIDLANGEIFEMTRPKLTST